MKQLFQTWQRWAAPALLLLAFLAFGLTAYAVTVTRDPRVRFPGSADGYGIIIDRTYGSQLQYVYAGTFIYKDSATTSDTNTVPGAKVGDQVILSPKTSIGSAAKWYASVTTDTVVTVTFNADPATTVTMDMLIVGKK